MKREQQTKRPTFWFLAIAIAIMILSNIPYWTGIHSQTDKLLFRGSYQDEADYAVHISMMQAGRMGNWMYQMRFTDEKHQPAFIRLFYLFLGHISKWIHLEIEPTFHIARWIFGLTALLSIYKLCLKVFLNQNNALFAFLLSSLGAGLGWLQLILGAPLKPISPIDFWLIDAYVFFSISLFPAFSCTIALMATALNLYFDFLDKQNKISIFLICVIAVTTQMINPIAFAVIDLTFLGTTISYWWKNKKGIGSHVSVLTIIFLCQIPLLIYNFLILTHNPFWSQFTLQNETLSPPLQFYFWGFLPFLPFAIWGGINGFRNKDEKIIGLTTWVIGSFMLAYLPVLIQRRFLLGITIPLGILAFYGLNILLQKITFLYKRKNLIYLGYVLLASVSSIYLVLGSSLFLQARPAEKFYSQDIENALIWLNNNATPNDFVLGNIQTSQLIAQRTTLRVYVGHEMETLNYKGKTDRMEAFYTNNEKEGWLSQTSIQWIIYGPYEKEITPIFIPNRELVLVYQNATVKIYKTEH